MSNRYPGMYDHLNKDDKFILKIDMKELVESVDSMNYGIHRFLSELVRLRKKSEWYTSLYGVGAEYREHTHKLEKLLEDGFY